MQILVLVSTFFISAQAGLLNPVVQNVVHLEATQPPPGVSGVWKTRVLWKPRWLKEWKSEIKPVWRKVWGPVQIHEWVPVPQPPPNYPPPTDSTSPVHQPAPSYPPLPDVTSTVAQPSPGYIPNTNSSSTQLFLSSSWQPEPTWKPTDSQCLLNSYQTIVDPNTAFQKKQNHTPSDPDLGTNESNYVFPRPNTEYSVGSADPETDPRFRSPELSEYLEPPRINNSPGGFLAQKTNFSGPAGSREVSPYAKTLAQAVVQDKVKQALNLTTSTRPGGLTEVVFGTVMSTTSQPSFFSSSAVVERASTTARSTSSSTTPSSPIFIVTPVNSG